MEIPTSSISVSSPAVVRVARPVGGLDEIYLALPVAKRNLADTQRERSSRRPDAVSLTRKLSGGLIELAHIGRQCEHL